MASPPRYPLRSPLPPTDEEIATWFQAGELLDHISEYVGLRDPMALGDIARQVAALSNSRQIDLLSLIESGAVTANAPHRFFAIQRFLTEALPHLHEEVPRVLAAIDTLVRQGGADMVASLPNRALRDWIRRDAARAEAIIESATSGDEMAAANLTFALEALGNPGRARAFLESGDSRICASAMTALSRISDPDLGSRRESIQSIGQALGAGSADMLCANAIAAVLAIAGENSPTEYESVVAVLERALRARGDGALYQAACTLSTHNIALHPTVFTTLLDSLLDVNPDHKSTIDLLDIGLKSALDSGYHDEVLTFLTTLLILNQNRLSSSAFNSVWHNIIIAPQDIFSRWLVDWLLSGQRALGAALTEIFTRPEHEQILLSLDRSTLPSSAIQLSYLARKAVGWFMLRPHLATSVLVAILGVCDDSVAQDVTRLLINPVLRNYPEMRHTLLALPPNDPSKTWTDRAVREISLYLSTLDNMSDILEIRPSEHHRRIFHLHQSDEIREAHKAAHAKSAFLNLFRHSTLLYGGRSLTYIEDIGGGPQRPIEMELGTHTFSMTLPRLNLLDPIGLQFMMTRLRSEPKPQ